MQTRFSQINLNKYSARLPASHKSFLKGEQPVQYIWFRLNKVLPNQLLRFSNHIFELFLIRQIFHGNDFLYIAAFKIFTVFISSCMDGLLENKRIFYQNLFQQKQPGQVSRDLSILLNRSITWGSLIALGQILFVSVFIEINHERLLALILFSTFIPIQFFINSAHTALIARKRVYMPLTRLSLAELMIILVISINKSALGPSAYFVMLAAFNIVSLYFSYKYLYLPLKREGIINHKYNFLKLPRAGANPQRKLNYKLVAATIATKFRQNILIILGYIFSISLGYVSDIFMFLYITMPLNRFASNWARIFYFDMTRIRLNQQDPRKYLLQYLLPVGSIIGLTLAFMAIGISSLVFDQAIFSALLYSLIFLYVATAIYSCLIMCAYSSYRYNLILLYEISALAILVFTYLFFARNFYEIIGYYAIIFALLSVTLIFVTGQIPWSGTKSFGIAKQIFTKGKTGFAISFPSGASEQLKEMIVRTIFAPYGYNRIKYIAKDLYLFLPNHKTDACISDIIAKCNGMIKVTKTES